MVKFMRLDDRMIHGQVAIRWTKVYAIKTLIVANDVAAANKTQSMVLQMAGPPGCRVSVMTIADTIKTITDPRAAAMNIMIIATNVRDIYTIAKVAANQIERLNFGNLLLDKTDPSYKELTPYVLINDEEKALIKELWDMGIKMDGQLIPEEKFIDLEKILKS